MSIPKKIQQQLEAAEAQLAQSLTPLNVVEDVSELAAPQPQVTTPEPAPAAPAPQPPAQPSVDWEQRFKTLQGMYNAEVPAMRAREKAMESTVASLQEQVKALQEVTRKPPEPAKAVAPDPKDVESFGADMIEMVQRYAERVFANLSASLNQQLSKFDERIGSLERNVGTVAQRTETTLESQFYAALTQMVPSWKTVNVSAEFNAWLDEQDDVYGLPRRAALEAAHKRYDAERVAAIFSKFISTRPAKPSAELANQVAPSASGSAPAPAAPVSKKSITQAQVQKFYSDLARGKYRGREAEAAQIEAEINLAAQEGRIL